MFLILRKSRCLVLLWVNHQASHLLQLDELLVVIGSNEALRSLPGS